MQFLFGPALKMRPQCLSLGAGCLLMCLLQCFFTAADGSPPPSKDWIESVEKADNHRHWERIVKRRASLEPWFFSPQDEDDTSHIVNVQDYYRSVFARGWGDLEKKRKQLYDFLNAITTIVQQDYVYTNGGNTDNIQDGVVDVLEMGVYTKPIRGRYLVMFQTDDSDDYLLDRTMKVLEKANHESRGRVRASDMHPLRHVGKGFTATLNSKALGLLARHPQISHIEEDRVLKQSAVMMHNEGDDLASTESHIPWNLDRIDQHSKVLDNSYNPIGDGKTVNIYIIDTGVRASHQEFEGRVHYANFDAVDFLTGSTNQGRDCNGHGTHCAGIAAGKTYGVAKKANIYNLRALNCYGVGALSGIVMGIDSIIKQVKEKKFGQPVVISQSLGVSKSATLNEAIRHAVKAGITCVGAAGNQAAYSCDFSPASAKVGIAVGATDKEDVVATFTNIGACTDMMAPGVKIKSASNVCDTCTRTLSGTSMAAPHVSGYAAIVLDRNPDLTAYQAKKKIIKQATADHVQMSAISLAWAVKTPNKLLYVPTATKTSIAENQGIHSRP